jgi:hypothetical protein
MADKKLRKRVPWFKLFLIVLVPVFTFKDAAVNLIAPRAPTHEQRLQMDFVEQVRMRRVRLTTLKMFGDHCDRQVARETARTLAFDGQLVTGYADDFARRCGDDPIIRKWAALMERRNQLREARLPAVKVGPEAALQ